MRRVLGPKGEGGGGMEVVPVGKGIVTTVRMMEDNQRKGNRKQFDRSSTKVHSRFTLSVMVAEKSIVCRVGAVILMISFICSAKTSSSIRSASSRMRTSTEWRLKEGALWRWSMRRPGVAEEWDEIH